MSDQDIIYAVIAFLVIGVAIIVAVGAMGLLPEQVEERNQEQQRRQQQVAGNLRKIQVDNEKICPTCWSNDKELQHYVSTTPGQSATTVCGDPWHRD